MDYQPMSETPRQLISIASVLVLLLGTITTGCDQIDISKSSIGSTLAETNPDSTSDSAGSAKTGVESIGPEGATRIYYQFVDASGRVQFVERIADVPVDWRKQVGFVEMSHPPPLTPMAARRSWKVSSQRTAEILAANAVAASAPGPRRTQREDVILYYATWCGYCKKAKAHLDRAGVDYDLRNVDNNSIKSELKEKTGRTGIPVLDFSGEILRGYSSEQYDKAIRTIRG